MAVFDVSNKSFLFRFMAKIGVLNSVLFWFLSVTIFGGFGIFRVSLYCFVARRL